MTSWKGLATAASLGVLVFVTPVQADEARLDATSTPSETVALRQEVSDLKERLARLENLLGEVAKRLHQSPTTAALAPGDARFMNAGLPASLPPSAPGPSPAPTPAPPPEPQKASVEIPEGIASTGGQPLSITGILDTYYTTNFNHPADGTNTLYYTNPNARGFGLNQAKLEIDAKGDGPVGFRSDIWFGSGARLFRAGLEPGPLEDVLYLQQAYGYYQWDNGAELDVGLFGPLPDSKSPSRT